jgi:hypothetical protein
LDLTWITDRIAIGGAVETEDDIKTLTAAGVTHIISMRIEFDETELASKHGIEVLFNGVYNDFQPKPPALFDRGIEFGMRALRKPGTKLLVHCTLGMHRAPAMALALLGAMGWPLPVAMDSIQKCRPIVYFADSYVESVKHCLERRGSLPSQAALRKITDVSGAGVSALLLEEPAADAG